VTVAARSVGSATVCILTRCGLEIACRPSGFPLGSRQQERSSLEPEERGDERAGAGVADRSVKELLASSQLAFAGAVEAAGQSTVGGVEANDRTVVVRVSQLLHAPEGVVLPEGASITVQLSPDLPALGPGEQATFFANGWVYGDTLAVTEVGRTSVEEAAAPTAAQPDVEEPLSPVEAARAELDDDDLVEHAREADAVIRGQVTALAQVPKEGPAREHDPDWWIATIHADVVARGEVPDVSEEGGNVEVLYANSLDRRWRQAPKPKAGQAGLWLLHRAREELAGFAPFELAHPIDVQPSLRLDLLRDRGLGQ
jgi:hypothetical protein